MNQWDMSGMTIPQRMQACITDMASAGFPKNVRRSVVALSCMECGCQALVARPAVQSLIPSDFGGCTVRVFPSLEVFYGWSPTNRVLLDPRWAADPDANAWLAENAADVGIQAEATNSGAEVWSAAAGGDMGGLYEYVLANQKAALIGQFSVGPTFIQMSAFGPYQLANGASTVREGPTTYDTWDEAVSWYLSPTPSKAFLWMKYLYPPHVSAYPADHNGDQSWIEGWIAQVQLGTNAQPALDNYYNGYQQFLSQAIAMDP